MKTRIEEMYIVERRNPEGKLWNDFSTLSGLQEEAKRKANKTDREIPIWATDNPQMRTIRIWISTGHRPYYSTNREE